MPNRNENLTKDPIDFKISSYCGRSEWADSQLFDLTDSTTLYARTQNYENLVNRDCIGSTSGNEYIIVK